MMLDYRACESTAVEAVPVEEKFPPLTEINNESIKMLSEAAMILSVVINDISSRKPESSTAGREPPHCLSEQAAMIERLSRDVMVMSRDIKGMITA